MYKFLLLLDRVFSELFGTNFNPQFLQGIEVWFEAFVYLHIRDAGECTYEAENLLMISFEVYYMVDNKCFSKIEEYLRANNLLVVPKKRGTEASASLASP